ncbi:hypothetical protein T484DRAFT_1946402 [Baffinella frigidus]|nr:hypothetical protein T484DRAFT_1946402 [Cryptophyta sp. CCMP2293]
MFRNVSLVSPASFFILGLASAAAAFAPSGGLPSLHSDAPRAACALRMQASTPTTDKLTSALFAKLDTDGSGTIDDNELMVACLDGHLELTMACLDGHLDPDNRKLLPSDAKKRSLNPKKRSMRVLFDTIF